MSAVSPVAGCLSDGSRRALHRHCGELDAVLPSARKKRMHCKVRCAGFVRCFRAFVSFSMFVLVTFACLAQPPHSVCRCSRRPRGARAACTKHESPSKEHVQDDHPLPCCYVRCSPPVLCSHPARCVLVLIVVHAVVCASRQPIGFGQEKALDRCTGGHLLPAPLVEPPSLCSFLCCLLCGGELRCDVSCNRCARSLTRSTPRDACQYCVGSETLLYVTTDGTLSDERTSAAHNKNKQQQMCVAVRWPDRSMTRRSAAVTSRPWVVCVCVVTHPRSLTARSLSVAMLLCCCVAVLLYCCVAVCAQSRW